MGREGEKPGEKPGEKKAEKPGEKMTKSLCEREILERKRRGKESESPKKVRKGSKRENVRKEE